MKVPDYLLFDPRTQKVTLYHHNGKRYVALKANAAGRLELPELDLEIAILDRWVRFWYKGALLPLPAEMQKGLEAAEREIVEVRKEIEKMLAEKREALMSEPDAQAKLVFLPSRFRLGRSFHQ